MLDIHLSGGINTSSCRICSNRGWIDEVNLARTIMRVAPCPSCLNGAIMGRTINAENSPVVSVKGTIVLNPPGGVPTANLARETHMRG